MLLKGTVLQYHCGEEQHKDFFYRGAGKDATDTDTELKGNALIEKRFIGLYCDRLYDLG